MADQSDKQIIFLLGGNHAKNIPPNRLDALKLDLILSEGVDGRGSSYDFLREPFFIIGSGIYSGFLWIIEKLFGRADILVLYNYAKRHGIPFRYVDVSRSELITRIHRPFNPIVWLIFFGLVLFLPSTLSPIPRAIIALFYSCFIYFAYLAMVSQTMQYRNEEMVKRTITVLQKERYTHALFYSGHRHTEEVEGLLKKEGFNIKILPKN